MEIILVPYLLRSTLISIPMVHNSESDVSEWGSLPDQSGRFPNGPEVVSGKMEPSSGSLLLPISCQILAQILDAVLDVERSAPVSDYMFENAFDLEEFARKLVWELCLVTERLLLHSSEHRSCAISLLLPTIFKSYLSHSELELSSPGQTSLCSR